MTVKCGEDFFLDFFIEVMEPTDPFLPLTEPDSLLLKRLFDFFAAFIKARCSRFEGLDLLKR